MGKHLAAHVAWARRASSYLRVAVATAALATGAWVLAAPADISRGLTWLQAQVLPTGVVVGQPSAGAQAQATCEAARTLISLAAGSPQIAALVSALQTEGSGATESLACLEQLRQQLGQPPAGGLGQRQLDGGGFAAYAGFAAGSVLDTGWALGAQMSLLSAPDKSSLLAWLSSRQQADGSFQTAGRADLLATAAVLAGLRDEASRSTAAAAVATKASSWLIGQRSTQTQWLADAATTAAVFEAVHPYTAPYPAIASEVESFLLAQQRADGSWDGDARTTAVVLRALALVGTEPQDPTQPASATVRGTVSFAGTGLPAAGATVAVTAAGALARTAITDAQGQYVLRGIPPGSASASASLGGARSQPVDVTLEGGTVAIFSPTLYADGQTPAGSRVRGKVFVFGSNAPLASVDVQVAGAAPVSSATDGTFDVAVAPGSLAVRFAKTDYVTQTQQVIVAAGSAVDLDVALKPTRTTSSLRGVVTDLSGQVVPGAMIAITNGPSATTGANGVYAFNELSGLQFTLVASAQGFLTRSFTVTLAEPADATRNLVLPSLSAGFLNMGTLELSPGTAGMRRDVTATAVVSNASNAAAFADTSAIVLDAQGRRVATLPGIDANGQPSPSISLAPGAQQQVRYRWNTSTYGPGRYTVMARLQTPGTATRENPDGIVVGTQQASLEITGSPSIFGSVTVDPPILRAGTGTPVKLSALIQNNGNIPLPAQSYKLSVIDTQSGAVTLTQSVSAEEIATAGLKSLTFTDWTPAGGGDFRVELSAPSTPATVTASLYVGDSGKATFTVDKPSVPTGNQKVRGTIRVTGGDPATGTLTDPLAPLVKQALTTAVRKSDELAYNHYVSNDYAVGRCFLCHVQSQAVVGGERNLRHAPPLDPLVRTTLLNGITQDQRANGSMGENTWVHSNVNATLALWATTRWRDQAALAGVNARLVNFVAPRQGRGAEHGTWPVDHFGAWWKNRMPLAALNVESMSRLKTTLPATPITSKHVGRLNLAVPTGDVQIHADAGGTLYVAHWANQSVHAVSPTGTITQLMSTANGIQAYNARPLGDGRLIVSSPQGIWIREANGTLRLLNALKAWDAQPYGDKFIVSPSQNPAGQNSRVYLLDAAGNLSNFIEHPLLAESPANIAVQPDGSLLVPSYYGQRLMRFNPDGTLRDIPLPQTAGSPVSVKRYRDGHLVVTDPVRYVVDGHTQTSESGLFFLNKDWVAERWLFSATRSVEVMPNGRVFLSHIESWDLSVTPRLQELTEAPINLATTLQNIETAVTRATDYLAAPMPAYYDPNDNIDVAFRLYGLHYARLHYAGTPRAATLESLMEPVAQILRTRQRADGGWRWKEGTGPDISDPLVTAIVGVALDNMNPSATSPQVRKTIEYLLAQQKPDGLWYSVHPNTPGQADGLADTALLATSWVEILLPIMLERLGVFDADVHVTFPANAVPSNPSPTPTSAVTAADGSTTYSWKLRSLTEVGQEAAFDVMLNGMQADEVRAVAESASLVFRNSFVDGSVTAVVQVPKVVAGTSMAASAFTDRPAYTEAEQALLSVVAANLGTTPREAVARFTVLDATGRPVQVLPLTPVSTVASTSTSTFGAAWPIAGMTAGTYGIRAEVLSPGGVLYAAGTASFTVTAGQVPAASARLSTDRTSYSAAQTVQLTARVSNNAANAALDDLRAVTEVKSAGGQVVFTRSETISQLPPASSRQFAYALPAATLSTGSYSAATLLQDALGQTLAQSTAAFSVLGADQTGVGLAGQLQVSPAPVLVGQPVAFTVTVTNSSTTNLANVPVTLRVLDPSGGQVIATLSGTVPDLPASQSRPLVFNWTALGVHDQVLVASATASVNGRDVPLAQSSLRPQGVPQLRVEPAQLAFSPINSGQTANQTLTLASIGSAPAGTLTFMIGGADATQFALPQGGCASASSVPVGATCTLTVSYRPQAAGTHTGEVRIGYAAGQSLVVPVTGRANAAAVLTGSLSVAPSEVPAGQSASLAYTVSNPAQTTATVSLRLAVRNPAGDEVAGWPLHASVGPNATYAGNQAYTVGTQLQALTAALTHVQGTSTTVLATASFSVVAAPAPVVKVDLATRIKRDARILMLASCSPSQDSHKGQGERHEREEHDDDDDDKRERRAEACTPQPDVPSCLSSRARAASDLFQSLGIPHKIVTTEAAFKHEMRCGGYNTYWVSGGAAKLDHWLVKEVRDAVWGGDSLVMDGEHDDRNQLLHAVAGVKYRGKLGRSNLTASIPSGSLFAQGSLPTQGQPPKFELIGGQRQASFTGSYASTPAIISNTYGNGRSLLFAFDLVGMVTDGPGAQVGQLVETAAGHVASGTAALTVGDTAAIVASVSNQGTRTVTVQVQGDLPAGVAHLGASPEPESVDAVKAVWSLILPGGTTQDVLWRVRSTQAGTATLALTVHSVPEGTGTLALHAASEVKLGVADGATLLQSVLPALQALQPPTSSGRSAKSKALDAAGSALILHNHHKYQEAIVQWTASANAVMAIAGIDTKPARDALSQALEASTDALCQGLSCLFGKLTLPAQVQEWTNMSLSRAVTNSCLAPARNFDLKLALTNRRNGELLLEQSDSNVSLNVGLTSRRSASWLVQSPSLQTGDWLDALLTASWQGHQIELARASVQTVPSQSACTPRQALEAGRFTPHGAAEGLFARGGKESHGGSDSWEWAIGTSVQPGGKYESDHIEWDSGKTYQWQLQVNASGQGSFSVKEGGRTVASESFSGASKLRLGNALRLGIRSAGDVGGARIAATMTRLDGQAVNVSLATTGAGQEKSQALYQPTLANGFSAEGTVKLTFGSKAPPAGARLQMSVQAGTAQCQ
jgi:hypothetical protein